MIEDRLVMSSGDSDWSKSLKGNGGFRDRKDMLE